MTPDPSAEEAAAQRWLRAAAAGDRAAFARLYRLMHPRLARFLARRLAQRDAIDDVINEAMLVVWRKAGEFRGESRVGTWITGIAYRCMLGLLRQSAPAEELSDAMREQGLPEAPADDPVLRDWLSRGLDTLPADQRDTLLLAYVMGETCEGIAGIMGCAVGTVKARLFHARVRLRHVLPALGGEPVPAAAGQRR